MTDDEKLKLLQGDTELDANGTGVNACVGHISGIARFGLPCLCMGDGPAGVGIQSLGLIATPKHFAANNQEWLRLGDGLAYEAVDAIVPERALREIYYPGFEAVVKQGKAGSIMYACNRVNGQYACENPGTPGSQALGLRPVRRRGLVLRASLHRAFGEGRARHFNARRRQPLRFRRILRGQGTQGRAGERRDHAG